MAIPVDLYSRKGAATAEKIVLFVARMQYL